MTAWDVTTAEYLQLKDVSGQDNYPTGLFFKPDGTKMYFAGTTNDNVYEYDLDPAWDVTSASYLQLKDVSGQDLNPFGLFFKPDGTKMYLVGYNSDSVNEYNLGTAWDVTSASYLQRKIVTSEDPKPASIFFKPDGTKMYLCGVSNDNVYEYDLDPAWDVTTASYLQLKDVSDKELAPWDISFKPDGTKMYVIGSDSKNVNEYDLGTPWNISTASYLQLKDVSDKDITPWAVFLKPDGTKMYVTANTNKNILEYDLPVAVGPANLKSVNAVTTANIKSINAVLIGDVKSINAIA